jgi:hypothetical protein
LPLTQSASKVQVAGQVAMAPLHTMGAQEGAPVEPWGAKVQVPSLPVTSQASQALEQAVLQQKPSTQRSLWH